MVKASLGKAAAYTHKCEKFVEENGRNTMIKEQWQKEVDVAQSQNNELSKEIDTLTANNKNACECSRQWKDRSEIIVANLESVSLNHTNI